MICKQCGAKIPDGAKFCGECGWVVDEKEAKKAEKQARDREREKMKSESPVEVLRLKRKVRKYRILTWVFGILFVFMCMAFAGANMDSSSPGVGTAEIPEGGFTLTGTFVVGEDEELPAGVYDIYSVDDYSADVKIYETMDDKIAEKNSDESKYMEWLYSKETKGFKFRDGYVVVIDEPGAILVKR